MSQDISTPRSRPYHDLDASQGRKVLMRAFSFVLIIPLVAQHGAETPRRDAGRPMLPWRWPAPAPVVGVWRTVRRRTDATTGERQRGRSRPFPRPRCWGRVRGADLNGCEEKVAPRER